MVVCGIRIGTASGCSLVCAIIELINMEANVFYAILIQISTPGFVANGYTLSSHRLVSFAKSSRYMTIILANFSTLFMWLFITAPRTEIDQSANKRKLMDRDKRIELVDWSVVVVWPLSGKS